MTTTASSRRAASASTRAVFDALREQPADALLHLIALYRQDLRPGKIDLGVGVYRDETGATPVLASIKQAEARLLADQASKAYLGAEGDAAFTAEIANLLFGDTLDRKRLIGLQTPGGTGALRLGAELIARGNPDASVWIGDPTWPNHGPIFREAGLRVRTLPFYRPGSGEVLFEAMVDALAAEARSGDVLLLHGCCHNPTGAGFAPSQWTVIASLCERLGVLPFLDLAYHGLGDGLAEDGAATLMLAQRLPHALIAYSCDKNFGMYRDRVGALLVATDVPGSAELIRPNVLAIARSLWSMPPDHGAAAVRLVLQDPALRATWETELAAMRTRLNGLRRDVAKALPELAFIEHQRGMFSLLPLATGAADALRESNGIYMAGNGRINIAGLTSSNLQAFATAVRPHLRT